MSPAAALRQDNFENHGSELTRDEVLSRYRHLRAISREHHAQIQKLLSPDAIMRHARRLGLAFGKTFILDDMDDLNFVSDLAIYTAPVGRSRAIDRYAAIAKLVPGSDEALVLDAMRQARFALVKIERRDQTAGLIVSDLFRGFDLWLMDEGLESSAREGWVLATRLFTPGSFSMTAGVICLLYRELVDDALEDVPLLRRKGLRQALDDRRFAEALYRNVVAQGASRRVRYVQPDDDDDR